MADEYIERKVVGHVRRVELSETEGRLAQLTMLLLRVGEPLHEAILVNILNATATFARVEQRLFGCTFAPAYPTGIRVDGGGGRGGRKVWIATIALLSFFLIDAVTGTAPAAVSMDMEVGAVCVFR